MFTNIQDADHVLISVSGGKDSSALMLWALANVPKHKLIAVHAKIDVDWSVTLDIVKAQCAQLDIPLQVVCAVDNTGAQKGILDHLIAKRKNRVTGELTENQWPSSSARWCTSLFKTGPIDKYARSFTGNVCVLIGERREESTNRAKLVAWRPDDKNTIKGRTIVKYSPILDMKESEVWAAIKGRGLIVHPCYNWGVTRASCAICIFSSDADIAIAAKYDPYIVKKYLQAEKRIAHTFRYKPATKSRVEIKERIVDILAKFNLDRAFNV